MYSAPIRIRKFFKQIKYKVCYWLLTQSLRFVEYYCKLSYTNLLVGGAANKKVKTFLLQSQTTENSLTQHFN